MHLRFSILAILGLTLLFTSCNKDEELLSVEEYLSQNAIEAQKTSEGLYYVIDNEGSSDRAVLGSIMAFNYRGSLSDGTVFDNSFDKASPLTISLSELIVGVQIGGKLVGKGGRITLYIPPSLGYGTQDVQGIPGNSMLIFEMEIIDFTEDYPDVLKSQEGLYMIIDEDGDDERPTNGSTIVFDYEAFLTDGTKFDSSIDNGEPLEIPITGLISGMQIGLSALGINGKGRMVIPPHLGYGVNPPSGSGIPANALLLFNVTLLEIK